jgi:hypothetical protein
MSVKANRASMGYWVKDLTYYSPLSHGHAAWGRDQAGFNLSLSGRIYLTDNRKVKMLPEVLQFGREMVEEYDYPNHRNLVVGEGKDQTIYSGLYSWKNQRPELYLYYDAEKALNMQMRRGLASLIGVHLINANTPVISNTYRNVLFRLGNIAARRRQNPGGDYGLRQYIIQKDGTALYIARINVELYAKRRSAILEYLEWLLKLPGVKVRVVILYKNMKTYDISIDADSKSYGLTDDQINEILEDLDRHIVDHTTLMQYMDLSTRKAWTGNNIRISPIVITSKSMRRLNDYIGATWPTADSAKQERYYKDEKRRHVAVDFGIWLFLDCPEPRFVGWGLPLELRGRD